MVFPRQVCQSRDGWTKGSAQRLIPCPWPWLRKNISDPLNKEHKINNYLSDFHQTSYLGSIWKCLIERCTSTGSVIKYDNYKMIDVLPFSWPKGPYDLDTHYVPLSLVEEDSLNSPSILSSFSTEFLIWSAIRSMQWNGYKWI